MNRMHFILLAMGMILVLSACRPDDARVDDAPDQSAVEPVDSDSVPATPRRAVREPIGEGSLTLGDRDYPLLVRRCNLEGDTHDYTLIADSLRDDGQEMAVTVSRSMVFGGTLLTHTVSVAWTRADGTIALYGAGRNFDGEQWCCGEEADGPLVLIDGNRLEAAATFREELGSGDELDGRLVVNCATGGSR